MLKTRLGLVIIALTCLISFSCVKTEEKEKEFNNTKPVASSTKSEIQKPEINLPIEVSKLANKNSTELDKTLGKPLEVKPTDDGGEYRLYQIQNENKGLAVRFYGDKAKSFNLLLTKPVSSSKETLKNAFGIDIGKVTPRKDPKEPLSESFQGIFNGVKFSKLLAKKDDQGKGFIFVLAEVEK